MRKGKSFKEYTAEKLKDKATRAAMPPGWENHPVDPRFNFNADADFILKAMGRKAWTKSDMETARARREAERGVDRASIPGKWDGVEYYGPGAAEADNRRRAILGLPEIERSASEPEVPAPDVDPAPKKPTIRERLKALRERKNG